MAVPLLSLLIPFWAIYAQPINDTIKARTLRNEKMYRMLNSMDDKGSSYEFTNITAWKSFLRQQATIDSSHFIFSSWGNVLM
jgi:hypothetical protein